MMVHKQPDQALSTTARRTKAAPKRLVSSPAAGILGVCSTSPLPTGSDSCPMP
jgi:hypothetical protein